MRTQTLNERMEEITSTCMGSCFNLSYPLLAGIEEHGEMVEKVLNNITWNPECPPEVQADIEKNLKDLVRISKTMSKYAKSVRHGSLPQPILCRSQRADETDEEFKSVSREIAYEIGDMEWDNTVLALYLGYTAQDVADMNHAKLAARKKRNEIDGSGDHERTKF